MSSGKKKGKKSKGKTLNLNDFLADTPTISANLNGQRDGNNVINVAALPTAPRAEQTGCYDESKVPDRPPYTAYVGNLPYDVIEEDLHKYFSDSEITSIRFPSDSGNHRGYGYIEPMNERCLRIDLATGNNRRDGDDRTNQNWRVRDGPNAYDEERGRDGHRGGGFQQRSDADLDQTWVRKSNFVASQPKDNDERSFGNRDRGFGGDRDRGFGGDRDRGFGGDRDRGFGGDRDKGFGGDRDRGFGGDRDRGFGGDRDRGFGGDRDRGFGGDRDRGFGGDRDRGFGGDRGLNKDRRGYEEENLSWSRKTMTTSEPEQPVQQTRKPLNLVKRTKPIENAPVEKVPIEKAPVDKPKSINMFGDAKPVNTAAKERMIEDKLSKLNMRESSGRDKDAYSYTRDSEINTETTKEDNKTVYIDAPAPTKNAWGH